MNICPVIFYYCIIMFPASYQHTTVCLSVAFLEICNTPAQVIDLRSLCPWLSDSKFDIALVGMLYHLMS